MRIATILVVVMVSSSIPTWIETSLRYLLVKTNEKFDTWPNAHPWKANFLDEINPRKLGCPTYGKQCRTANGDTDCGTSRHCQCVPDSINSIMSEFGKCLRRFWLPRLRTPKCKRGRKCKTKAKN